MKLWLMTLMLTLPQPSDLITLRFPAPFNRVKCHRVMMKPLTKALSCVILANKWTAIHTYDGCYVHRNIEGTDRFSLHAYGIAIDINAQTNMPGVNPAIDPVVVRCFQDAGFKWGGDWATPDGMHFELKEKP